MESVTPMAIGALGSWETIGAAAALNAAATRNVTLTVRPGEAVKLEVTCTKASATESSDVMLLYPVGSGDVVAGNSVASHTRTVASATPAPIAPFGEIGPGKYQITITAGTVNLGAVTINKQRVR